MAWYVSGNNLQMCEGDFGVELPLTISGTEFTAQDVIRITFKTAKNGDAILTKEYTPTNGALNIVFTEEESALFPVGSYVYVMDWLQSGSFMCNIINMASFKVVDKA